jgi:hypothetical protein
MIWIRHPNLPGQETEVPAQSLPHHLRGGWEEFTPDPPEPYKDPDEKTESPTTSAGFTGPEKKPATPKKTLPKDGDK